MMTTTTVRVATESGDLRGAALLRWEWKGDDDSAARAEFADGFVAWAGAHAGSHTCFVAERHGAIVGCAWLALTDRVPGPGNFARRTGDIQSVYVTVPARRAGVGAALINAILDRAAESGAERVVVHSSVEAVSFYRELGFRSSDILLDTRIPVGGPTPAERPRPQEDPS